ncbi:MAG: LLM class flavin-dependent oxidoreductase [Gemmatimonadetes bacterium]|nr:LLM class flavin-dependent oxidoreductase [Gemmatimonadota bacterium]
MIPISILDLAPIREGGDAGQAFDLMREQAKLADRMGYTRYWLAEHHNMSGIGSAATSVLIGHVAEATDRIRVGSGGIMLPNHAPLVIAEQFGTLESLYPGRIDLGLGRAPGTDQRTARALRRTLGGSPEDFPRDVMEVQHYFKEPEESRAVRAVPGAGLRVPIWLLGSSMFSAQLAAHLGLPYAFASHFAPDFLMHALDEYRLRFEPSEYLDRPYAMAAMNVVAADTEEEAEYLFTSQQVASTNMMRGKREPFGPPIPDINQYWQAHEIPAVENKLNYSFVGSADSVQTQVGRFLRQTEADELITTVRIFDPEACHRSLEILAEVAQALEPALTFK